MKPYYSEAGIDIYLGDCREVMKTLADNSVDAVVTDPPYELGFMGKKWDGTGIAYDVSVWKECLRVLKPGGHLLAFGGSRTHHRLACAIEDVGFDIRETVLWLFGSGFPKSLDVSKQIDKAAGAEREGVGVSQYATKRTGAGKQGTFANRGPGLGGIESAQVSEPTTDAAKQWDGWGTALKPAAEFIVMARKPLSESTVAANVLKWGTGGINVDGCRVETIDDLNGGAYRGVSVVDGSSQSMSGPLRNGIGVYAQPVGRWPANVIHDGSDEVLAGFPDSDGNGGGSAGARGTRNTVGQFGYEAVPIEGRGDSGSAARFFYTAKASREDREQGLEYSPQAGAERTAGFTYDLAPNVPQEVIDAIRNILKI